MAEGAFLRVERLTKAYRSGWGLNDVSFELPGGTIAALGGPNGSGKSTLLRCLAGLASYRGSAWIDGRKVDASPASRETIGYLPQSVAMPDHATIGEVLDLFADLRGVDRSTIPLPGGFVRDDDVRIGTLSGGQRHRVALAVALLGRPRLLLLDEPVANLDEEGRIAFWSLLRRLRDRDGVTSIVSSPSPSDLRGVADRALFLDDGWLMLEEDLTGPARLVSADDPRRPAGGAPVSAPAIVIASWEYRSSVRARWVLTMAAIFGLLCVTVTLLAFRTVRELGLTGIGPASATLVNLGVLLPSLMGLLLGAGSLVGAREQGMLSMMCAQPVRRSSIAFGAFLGLTGSLWTTLGIGYGVALMIMAGVARGSDVPALATLIGATFGVAAASVAIGIGVSSLVSSRAQAVAAGVGLWIVLALGVDLALAALAPTVHLGPAGLLGTILLNPLESGRILALLGTNFEGTALGPFGAYLISRFGTVGSVLLLAANLLAWTVLPLLVARWALPRKDL